MNVKGIEWTHPRIGDYGFDPSVFRAAVGDVELVAWLRTTPAYDTYWTVRADRGGELVFQLNFVGCETALVGAAVALEALA